MDFYLSINNRERVIQLPVPPAEFTISSSQSNETFSTISGDLKIIGNLGLKVISFSSIFPLKELPFSKNNDMLGWDYVTLIEELRTRKLPFRLIITNTPINIAVVVDEFEYGQGRGDIIRYSITLSEFILS